MHTARARCTYALMNRTFIHGHHPPLAQCPDISCLLALSPSYRVNDNVGKEATLNDFSFQVCPSELAWVPKQPVP